MTFREIVFRLSVDKHPELQSRLAAFTSEVEAAYDEVAKASEAASRQMSGTVPGMGNAEVQRTMQAEVQAVRTVADRVAEEKQSIADLEAQVEADRRSQQLERVRKFTDEREKVERELAQRIQKIKEGTNQDSSFDVETEQRMIQAEYAKSADRIAKIDENLQKELAAQAAAARKEKLAGLKIEERAVESAQARYESLQEQVRNSKRETMTAFAEIGSSVMSLTRGFVALGLAGEEDTQKIVQGLLKVQGMFDIISGGIQTWVKINQAIEGVRRTLLATAAAEEALAVAAAGRAAIQARTGGMGGAAGEAVGSAAGSAAGSLASGAAGGALSRSRILGGIVKRGAVAGARMAAPVAAAAGGVALASDYFSGDGYSRGGWGEFIGAGGVGVDTLSSLARWANPTGKQGLLMDDSPFVDYANSRDATARSESRFTQQQQLNQQQRAAVAGQVGSIRQGFAVQAMSAETNLAQDLSGMKSPEAQRKRLAEEILETEKQIAAVQEAKEQTAGRFEELITEYANEQLRLEQRKKDLAQERAAIAVQAAQQELDASEQTLRRVDQRIEQQSRQMETMQASMRSGRERFGLMDDDQQQEVLALFKRAQAGEELSAEDLRKLRAVGSKAAEELVAGQAEARAKAGGADELFAGEADAISKLEKELRANFEVRADVAWEVALNKENLEEQTAELERVVRSALAEQLKGVSETVENAMRGEIAGIIVRMNGLEQQVRDGGGGR